jgi:c-di-GMP-binding flagellar brake protein YcgR
MSVNGSNNVSEVEESAYQRRWTRYKIDVRLKVTIADGAAQQTAFGRANNLSYGGMGAYIPCAIPVGGQVVLEVSFPYSTSEVKVKAVVRSCEGFRYGLEFQDVPASVRAVIEKNCTPAS